MSANEPLKDQIERTQAYQTPDYNRSQSIATAVVMSGILVSFSILVHAFLLKGSFSLPGLKGFLGKEPTANTNQANTQPQPTDQGTQPQEGARVDVSVDDDPSTGPMDAKVTIIEFSDFQCPFCDRFHKDAYKNIVKDYVETGKVRLVFRDYPLSFHANAQLAAEASQCAFDQNKFWEYHDKLFDEQSAWSNLSNDQAKAKFVEYAGSLGLNNNQFSTCLTSGKYTEEVKKDTADGTKAGVQGTPTTFINGVKIVGAQPFSVIKQTIDNELNK